MRRLAVAIALVVVATCTSALGEEVWTWSWNTERPTDLTYDANSNLWLTSNNGAHAVAMGWAGSYYWTTVVAEVRLDHQNDDIHSVTSYDWSDESRQTPFKVWEDDAQHHQPAKPCVSANGSYKFWMSTEVDAGPSAPFQCIGASAPLCTLGVRGGTGINFTTASTENNDTTFASACYPGTSSWLFAGFENYDAVPEEYVLSSRASRTGGTGWEPDYVPIEWGDHTHYVTQPSLATGTGDGSYVYVAYKTPDGGIKFERSNDHGENWGSQYTLTSAGSWPCIAALGQFVFACWHNTQNKIVYRFSTNAGGSWSDPVSKGDAASYAQTNVSAIIEDGRPRVLLTCRRWIGGKHYTYFEFGTLVTDHICWSDAMHLSPPSQGNADLRPSLATAIDGTLDPHYSGRLVYSAPIPSYKRGFHLRRGGWTAFEA